MPRKHIIIAVIIGLLTFSAGVLFYSPKSPTPSSKTLSQPPIPYNVILISIDTLRADHLGVYGYSRNTSPALDRLAQESILFEQAITQSSFTLASHASLFTSQYPMVHETFDSAPNTTVSLSKLTLAEALKMADYKTAAFVGGRYLSERYGLTQGFDIYQDSYDSEPPSFRDVIPSAMAWLRKNKSDPFFLFMHGYDVHSPFHSPAPFDHIFDPDYEGVFDDEQFRFSYSPAKPGSVLHMIEVINHNPVIVQSDKVIPLEQRDINHVIAHYDGGILYTDSLLKEFFEALKEMGVYDNSIIIVLSDHGEMLGDSLKREGDGRLFGRSRLYEEIVRVPLIIRHPDFSARAISTQVQLIDILPTIFDFLHIPISEEMKQRIQGNSLVPLIEGRADKHFNDYVFGQADGYQPVFVRTNQWKLVSLRGDFVLYNLYDDPKETQNVINQYPDVAEKLKQKLEEWKLTNLRKKSQLEKNHVVPDL